MGIDAIDGSAVPAREAAHRAAAPDKAPADAGGEVAAPPPEKPARGVPGDLGVQQQLPPNTRLRVDEETNQIIAQILNENDEVIRQIPPEQLLELSARFNKLQGLLFNRES